MKVLTFSRHFPKGHPKAGRPTGFVEKVLYNLVNRKVYTKSKAVEWARETGIDDEHPMCYIDTFDQYDCVYPKAHTVRGGSRFSPGDMASLRVWSGAPYRSKQVEFAQVEVKTVWPVEIYATEFIFELKVNGVALDKEGQERVANNDGLSLIDFYNWFNIHPKKKQQVFTGQVICWESNVNY